MGACCTGKEGKNDTRHEELNTRNLRNSYNNDYNSNLPEIEYEVEKSEYSKRISNIVKKYSNKNENDRISTKIKIFSIEQLWNASKFHNDDYSNSEYLLLDTRESNKRKENFL